jgi:hypothetical protein
MGFRQPVQGCAANESKYDARERIVEALRRGKIMLRNPTLQGIGVVEV